MRLKLYVASVISLGVLMSITPAFAHHGDAACDDKITEFKNATVTKVARANPHALVDFDAVDAKGSLAAMREARGGATWTRSSEEVC